jgi:hypothetical protein
MAGQETVFGLKSKPALYRRGDEAFSVSDKSVCYSIRDGKVFRGKEPAYFIVGDWWYTMAGKAAFFERFGFDVGRLTPSALQDVKEVVKAQEALRTAAGGGQTSGVGVCGAQSDGELPIRFRRHG